MRPHVQVMEYVDGGELFAYIVKNYPLKINIVRKFFQQLICAVEQIHYFRIVHRDLKPENVLVDAKGTWVRVRAEVHVRGTNPSTSRRTTTTGTGTQRHANAPSRQKCTCSTMHSQGTGNKIVQVESDQEFPECRPKSTRSHSFGKFHSGVF